jgi:hypothetical protein
MKPDAFVLPYKKYTVKRSWGYQTASKDAAAANHLQRQLDVGTYNGRFNL